MRVLVSAASKHGATHEIAEAIANGLAHRGVDALLRNPEEVTALDGFDAVVLGSAVYAGHWMRPARGFAERFEDELRTVPVWLFSSGPVGAPHPKPETEPGDIAPLLESTGAVRHQPFCGRIDMDRLNFVERSLVHALHSPVGDFRDWDAVDAFAAEIAGTLSSGAPESPAAAPGATI